MHVFFSMFKVLFTAVATWNYVAPTHLNPGFLRRSYCYLSSGDCTPADTWTDCVSGLCNKHAQITQ